MANPEGPGPEIEQWVAAVAGLPVIAVRKLRRWRPTWFIDVGTGRHLRTLLLKSPRAPRRVTVQSLTLQTFGLDREGDALEALSGSVVPVPGVVGRRTGEALLIDVVPGTGQVTTLSPEERGPAMSEYGGFLAALHQLDPNALRLATVRDTVPGAAAWQPGPLGAAIADWALVAPMVGPEPLIELGLRWLRATQPTTPEPRLLHGDAGADQFMVDGGRVAALIDWELAYVGDPMSDLGYAGFREALYPTGAYRDLLVGYAGGGGDTPRAGAVRWYTAAAALVMLMGVSRDVHRPRMKNPEASQRIWWDALARFVLCQVIGEHEGRPSIVPTPGHPHGAGHPIAAALADLHGQHQRARRTEDDDAHCERATRALEQALSRASTIRSVGGTPDEQVALLARDGRGGLDRLLTELSADAAARVWALAPLAELDTWDGSTAGWERRLTQPILPDLNETEMTRGVGESTC